MSKRIKGTRSRPRLALVGEFVDDDLNRFRQLFPTIWLADDTDDLIEQVDFRELDLLVIGSHAQVFGLHPKYLNYFNNTHIICFSEKLHQLPGPYDRSYIYVDGTATTEEYSFPDIPLSLHRRRELDFQSILSTRGWKRLELSWPTNPSNAKDLRKTFRQTALIIAHLEQAPLAVMYCREDSNLGVACLPNSTFDQPGWVELISMVWAESDRERFPDFGDWTKTPEWMLPEEQEIIQKINALEEQKQSTIRQLDEEISCLSQELAQAGLQANQGRRRLLTAQNDELLEEAASVFTEIGFEVELVDPSLGDDQPKREDLRLRISGEETEEWEAIVEVRGYSKSAGKTNDFQRLARFASFFQQEKGHLPNKRIYVVNGQIEIHNPTQREEPLTSAAEDIEEFSKDGGVIIWSVDLFRVAKLIDQCGKKEVRDSIKDAIGRWQFQLAEN